MHSYNQLGFICDMRLSHINRNTNLSKFFAGDPTAKLGAKARRSAVSSLFLEVWVHRNRSYSITSTLNVANFGSSNEVRSIFTYHGEIGIDVEPSLT